MQLKARAELSANADCGTHRQHQAPERDLSAHGHVRPNQSVTEERGEAGNYGNACRRAVLGDGSSGEVQVDVRPFQGIRTPRHCGEMETKGGAKTGLDCGGTSLQQGALKPRSSRKSLKSTEDEDTKKKCQSKDSG